MADGVFNIAKGYVSYYATLPAAADALQLVLLKTAGLEADDTLNNYTTLTLLLAGASDEADFTGYSRKTLASPVATIDNGNNWVTIDANDATAYTNTGGASQAISKALVVYDPDTGVVDDTVVIPLVYLDCVVTFDVGVATTVSLNTAGFYRAA